MTMFSDMKKRLDERSKSFAEQMDAATEARQHEIDTQLGEARARAAKSRAALAAHGGPSSEAVEVQIERIKRDIAESARGDSQAAGADAAAVAAEQSARFIFDLALNYIDEAVAASLEASFARDRAYVLKHDAPRGVVGGPSNTLGAKVGALVDQVVGSAKHDLGKVTGSTRMEIEGATQEERGHADWAEHRKS